MKVINIHRRLIDQPEDELLHLFKTLATSEDQIWPLKNWPAIRFKNGLKKGSLGGHGQIRYSVIAIEAHRIRFKFHKPIGFEGIHEFQLKKTSDNTTEISHEIKMQTTSLKATLSWICGIRWLHDALIEDAFDTVENHFHLKNKKTPHSFWVTFLRALYKRKH